MDPVFLETSVLPDGSPLTQTPPTLILHFWSPTCVECLTDIHYIKTRLVGLPVLGIVTPRFSFEEIKENILHAMGTLGLPHTVATASGRFFGWFGAKGCHLFVIADSEGNTLYEQLGGGGYYWLGNAIKDLFGVRFYEDQVKRLLEDFEAADSVSLSGTDWYAAKTPWRFLRVEGEYDLGGESLRVRRGRVEFNYRGRRLYAIVAPQQDGSLIGVRLNGHPLRSHLMGDDVVKLGNRSYIRLDRPRLYSVVDGGWGEYRLSLEIESPCELYALVAR